MVERPPTPDAVPEPVRRRIDEVFGDVLPEVTRDETAAADDPSPERDDEWLRANRPPHHDDRG